MRKPYSPKPTSCRSIILTKMLRPRSTKIVQNLVLSSPLIKASLSLRWGLTPLWSSRTYFRGEQDCLEAGSLKEFSRAGQPGNGTCWAQLPTYGELSLCFRAIHQTSSSQEKALGLPVHLHDARRQLQRQEKACNKPHWTSTLMGRGGVCVGSSTRGRHWNTRHEPKSDCTEYVQSGQKLYNKTLQSLAEYFQLNYKTCKNNDSLQHHHAKKICTEAKCKLHQELEEWYLRKLCYLANQCRSRRFHRQCNNGYHCQNNGQCKYPKLLDDGGCNNDKQDDKKGPPKHADKDFKPCHVHSKNAQHLYKECVPIWATRKHPLRCAQTTTTSIGTTATTRITATPVAIMSHAGVTILPCPARAWLAQAAQAKRRSIIILTTMVNFPQNGGRSMCPLALRKTKKLKHWSGWCDVSTCPKLLISWKTNFSRSKTWTNPKQNCYSTINLL